MDVIPLTINDEDCQVAASLWDPLLKVLREEFHLLGAKRGCDYGGCGACTVLVDGEARYGCMMTLAQCRGKKIQTIEGLSAGKTLDPVQESFAKHDAAQCGYCTPGMILMAKALLRKIPSPTESEVQWYLVGNLCRCTGYKKIVQAVQGVTKRSL
jgi:carbon-monoxide dehydrogenase small subunit